MTKRIYSESPKEPFSGGIIVLEDSDVEQYLANVRAKGDTAYILTETPEHPADMKRRKRHEKTMAAWDRVWRGEEKVSDHPICDPPSGLCCYKREWE